MDQIPGNCHRIQLIASRIQHWSGTCSQLSFVTYGHDTTSRYSSMPCKLKLCTSKMTILSRWAILKYGLFCSIDAIFNKKIWGWGADSYWCIPVLILIQGQPFQLSTWIREFIPKSVSTKKKRQNRTIQVHDYKIDIEISSWSRLINLFLILNIQATENCHFIIAK
jgi:hypothetical protein